MLINVTNKAIHKKIINLIHCCCYSEMLRSQSADLLPMEIYGYIGRQLEQQQQQYKQNISNNSSYAAHAPNQAFLIGSPSGSGSSAPGVIGGGTAKKMVKQLSNASQQSSSSTSSSVQSAPSHIGSNATEKGQSPGRWSSHEHYLSTMQHMLPVHQEQQKQHYKQQLQLQLQQQSNTNTEDVTPKTSICESTNSAASTSAASVASSYSDTTVEDGRIGGDDDISLTGSIKKRKRRLRFPFGRRKSNESNNSTKSKLA